MSYEHKLIIPTSEWDALRAGAGIDGPGKKQREVWFFDTPSGHAFRQRTILRARIAEKSDTTVKLRDIDALTPELLELLGAHPDSEVKQEYDQTGDAAVLAVSLRQRGDGASDDDERGTKTLRALVAGEEGLKDVLTLHQRALACLRDAIPWRELRAWGPIASRAWEVKRDGFEIDVERWTIGDEALLEVSHKSDSAGAIDDVRALLAAWGVEASGLPGGKTRWALRRLGVAVEDGA